MATIDEVLATMPEVAAEAAYEYLTIDPTTRRIIVPEAEEIFGVEGDGRAERKYFICPRYVGDNLDLATCFLEVIYRNANGDVDAFLVQDAAVSGDLITFSWELSRKVTQYKGQIQFVVCACYPHTGGSMATEWNTTVAVGTVLEGLEPDSSSVEAETADVITQLRAETAAQTGAVEACGAAQVKAVETAAAESTEDAKEQIEAKGDAVKASIPADYTTLANTVDRLTRDRAAAIVCDAEGTPVQVTDASADPLQGLRIFGRSTQDGDPTPDNPVNIVSLTAPVVTVCGKNLVDASAMLRDGFMSETDGVFTLTKGTQRFSKTQDCYIPAKRPVCFYAERLKYTGSADFWMGFNLTFEDGSGSTVGLYVNGAPHTVRTYTKAIRKIGLFMSQDEPAGAEVQFKNLQVELSEAPTEYEKPYTGQTMAAITPAGLSGIPVASGGNYTDADGQQWIADEVDLARGVYVQRVKVVEYDGSADESWWAYTSPGYEGFGLTSVDMLPGMRLTGYCNRFPVHTSGATEAGVWLGADNNIIYVHNAGEIASDLASWKAWLQTNPVTLIYQLATPVETSLTTEELQAFRALHSCEPTTTVLNDAGAWMAVEYAADPKLYIDRKIAELVAANNT